MTTSLYVPKVIHDETNMRHIHLVLIIQLPPPPLATGLLSTTLTDCKQEAINESAGRI